MVNAKKKSHVAYSIIKRLLDIVFSLIGLIFLLPLFLIVGFMVKKQDGGPVFFKQSRVGKNGKVFKLIKFRSMAVDNDMYDFSKEDKITKFGDFIRKTSIDELPQFWNVLKGDMSFVGPRPWVKEYYDNMNKEQRRRHDVRPGITGLAQVKGRNGIPVTKRIQYDLEYIDNLSIIEDIMIVFLTFGAIFKKESACSNKYAVQSEIKELKSKKQCLR